MEPPTKRALQWEAWEHGSMGAWEHVGVWAMSWDSQCDVSVDTTFAGDHSSRGCEF